MVPDRADLRPPLPSQIRIIWFDGSQIANPSIVLQLQPHQALPFPMVHASRYLSSHNSGNPLFHRQRRLQRLHTSRVGHATTKQDSRTEHMARTLAFIRYFQDSCNVSALCDTGEVRIVHEQQSAHVHLDGHLAS
jgi:hypothetical protein